MEEQLTTEEIISDLQKKLEENPEVYENIALAET
jgi:hypothetical protein